jgi:hypothetical protein
MAASCCTCMAWGIVPPCASVVVLVLCVWVHMPAGPDFSCEAGTCRASWGFLQWGTGRRCSQLDVLPVWVLTRVLSPPCPESLP